MLIENIFNSVVPGYRLRWISQVLGHLSRSRGPRRAFATSFPLVRQEGAAWRRWESFQGILLLVSYCNRYQSVFTQELQEGEHRK